ncbi:unnamed protein product [Microthlaspi erraticum]|uniref:KIB1-4 beta-propeller domain-containing protein n=1 Tax=Microthlaspi erraticum TaxID=1685480 RepID=A0A6D2J737_9BRAS|nr:unnamed protein product [Microthlaspi erraticum]
MARVYAILELSPCGCEPTVEFKIPGSESDPTLMNMLDCQIFPLGHHYRMIGEEPKDYRGLAFLCDFGRFKCRVSRLDDEEDGKWVEVTDLGDRVLFIGRFGNVCCSVKELPDGCGLSRNSLLFTNGPESVSYLYKYGVDTGNVEDDLCFWILSRENPVTFLSTYPVLAFRVEC